MGSKRELLDKIDTVLENNLEDGDTLLDIFAGTCGVGLYFRDKYPIYSNDIQKYSQVISEGTIQLSPFETSYRDLFDFLRTNYDKNYHYVQSRVSNQLAQSNFFKKTEEWDKDKLAKYLSFIKSIADPTLNLTDSWIEREYKKQSIEGRHFPYVQTLHLFSEMYFSTQQCIEIDSLKYSIDELAKTNKDLAALFEVALIHSFSYCSAGTGHFAQFRDLSTISSVKDVFLYRSRSVLDYFLRKAEEIFEGIKINKYSERSNSFSKHYIDILKDKTIMRNVQAVYADPPYSFVHYSRFYHAIEDLCAYDYPKVEFKGRYRTDRHQSPFCVKSKVAGAFRDMFRLIRPYQIPLLISYSNTGMIQLKEVQHIAMEEGFTIDQYEISHKHSTLGRLNDKDRDVTEALIFCR